MTSLDNYISGKKENHVDNVDYVNMDAKNILSLDQKYDLIFHLGEYSRVENSLKKIDFVLDNNINPILNILKFAKASQMPSLFMLAVALNMLMMDEINSKVRIHFLNGKILSW